MCADSASVESLAQVLGIDPRMRLHTRILLSLVTVTGERHQIAIARLRGWTLITWSLDGRDPGVIHHGMAEPQKTKWVCTCDACAERPRSSEATQHRKLNRLMSGLDEKHARRVLGLLAEMEGHGGIARLSRVTGVSRTTILHGQRDLVGNDPTPADRVRRPGGGRKRLEKKDPD